MVVALASLWVLPGLRCRMVIQGHTKGFAKATECESDRLVVLRDVAAAVLERIQHWQIGKSISPYGLLSPGGQAWREAYSTGY